jgi:hypothetical protein
VQQLLAASEAAVAAAPVESFTAVVVEPGDATARERVQRSLAADGVLLPLPHHWAAAELAEWERPWLIALRDGAGRFRASVPVFGRPLPLGHRVLRAERFGAGMSPEAMRVAAQALARLTRADARNLRLDVEIFSRDAAVHAAAAEALAAAGLSPREEHNRYTSTIVLDLAPDEAALLAGFSGTVRRHIRNVAKHPVEVRPVSDPAFAGRMNDLVQETLARTGGLFIPQPWAERIAFGERHPELSRIVGMFRTDVTGPESLVSFMWGCFHGDHAQYNDGASTRVPELKVALSYPLMWDLMSWAKRGGARWFDLGGVTTGHKNDDSDPLGGISDFKRLFSEEVARVGSEWVLHPGTIRVRLADAARAGMRLLARVRASSGRG